MLPHNPLQTEGAEGEKMSRETIEILMIFAFILVMAFIFFMNFAFPPDNTFSSGWPKERKR